MTIGDSLEIKDARRRRSSADARPVSSSRDAGLAKIMPGRKARFAGKQRPLRKSIAERFAALTRERRELKPIGLAMKFTPSHASLSSHFD